MDKIIILKGTPFYFQLPTEQFAQNEMLVSNNTQLICGGLHGRFNGGNFQFGLGDSRSNERGLVAILPVGTIVINPTTGEETTLTRPRTILILYGTSLIVSGNLIFLTDGNEKGFFDTTVKIILCEPPPLPLIVQEPEKEKEKQPDEKALIEILKRLINSELSEIK